MSWMHGSQVANMTEDGELWITETERENNVFIVYGQSGLNTDTYIALIDIDNPLFPHRIQGQDTNRIDITNVYLTLDVAANTAAEIRYGLISRIDGTDADIWYFSGLPFVVGAQQEDRTLIFNFPPSQLKADLVGGVLQHGLTNLQETNVAAVNTVTALDSPLGVGTVIPGVGDIIVKYDHTSGSSNFATFVFYHSQ